MNDVRIGALPKRREGASGGEEILSLRLQRIGHNRLRLLDDLL